MEKSRFPRGYKVYFPLVLLFALLVFVMPRSPKFNYDYRKGSLWMYEDLVSQFDFPLLKSEEQYKAELQRAGSSTVPVYRQDPAVLEAAYSQLSSSDLGKYNDLKPVVNASLGRIYSKGILPRNAASDPAEVMYIQKDVRASKVPFQEVYTVESAASALRQ